jgi:hypothetical protein
MALGFAVPLANGTLLVPRLLSNGAEAPVLGETALLYNMTRMPVDPASVKPAKGWNLPTAVWVILVVELGAGGLLMRAGWKMVRPKAKAAVPVVADVPVVR